MIQIILCWLGVHKWDPACSVVQREFWTDDGTVRAVRYSHQCKACGHRRISYPN